MLSFFLSERAPLSSAAVRAAARTGDLILYTADPPEPPAKRRKAVSTAAAAPPPQRRVASSRITLDLLLSMLPAAIAFGNGVRDTSTELDSVGVVVETKDAKEPEVLFYNTDKMLCLLPLSEIKGRPACLRPLMTERGDTLDKTALTRRQAVHRLITTAVDDLIRERVPTLVGSRTIESQAYLAAFLLYRSGVIGNDAATFCSTGADIETMFGAETLYLDGALTRDFAYGNQIWLS